MKFVLFKGKYSYCDFMCEDLRNNKTIEIKEAIDLRKRVISRFILRLLKALSRKLYTRYFMKLNVNGSLALHEEVCFVSFDSSPTAQVNFVADVKRIYPNSHSVLIVYNSIEGNLEKAKKYSNQFDLVFSFDPYDAKEYGWYHFLGLMPTCICPNNLRKEYDIVFIGNDKGRYQLIKDIYIKLSSQGHQCFFYVVSKETPTDEIDHLLLKTSSMPFNELIEIEKKAKCILDITNVSNHKQGLSLRILEAIYCNARVISNNSYTQEVETVRDNCFYFEKAEQLDKISSFLDDSAKYNTVGFGFSPILNRVVNDF